MPDDGEQQVANEATPDTAESVQSDATEAPVEDIPAGPWDEDLAARFQNANQRRNVAEFLREKVQPHLTKVEQQAAQRNENAERLWNDFRQDSDGTFERIATELYGADHAKRMLNALRTEDTPAPDFDAPDELDLDELPQEARETIEWAQAEKQKQQWNALLADVAEKNPDLTVDEELFTPFVIASEGRVDQAVESYKEWLAKFPGAKTEEAAEEAAEETAPPVVDGKVGRTGREAAREPQSMDEALADMYAMMKQADTPPPTV